MTIVITASLLQANEFYSTEKMIISYFEFSLDATALSFQLNKFDMYIIIQWPIVTFKDYKFLARVVQSSSTYLLQLKANCHLKFITMVAKQ